MTEEYPGSERHFGCGAPMKREPRMTNEQRVEAIRSAAVDFANDYGPLPAANQGDEAARHEVAHRLWKCLRRHGLSIVQGDI